MVNTIQVNQKNFFVKIVFFNSSIRENHTVSREKMLNREKLVSTIQKFCSIHYSKFIVSELIHKGAHRHRVEIEADGSFFYVDFHFKTNGSTSIDVSSGQHIDKKKQIMVAILNDPSCLLENTVIGN